jgi:hypothetical protein
MRMTVIDEDSGDNGCFSALDGFLSLFLRFCWS